MTRHRFLLDEMLSPAIAAQLRDLGHDADRVVADPARRGLPDQDVLALAAASDRIVVTTNIRDFAVLDRSWRAEGRDHAGLVLVPSTSLRQTAGFIGAVVTALDAAAARHRLPARNGVVFLTPR